MSNGGNVYKVEMFANQIFREIFAFCKHKLSRMTVIFGGELENCDIPKPKFTCLLYENKKMICYVDMSFIFKLKIIA